MNICDVRTILRTDNTLKLRLQKIAYLVGNTPIMRLQNDSHGVIAKLEYTNFSGSIKDRAAYSILQHAIETEELNKESTIIESTSGNFGVSLALFSIALGLKFIAVIDPNITSLHHKTLKLLCHDVICVQERDNTGGYLINRLNILKEFKANHTNIFHPNQYENIYNFKGYSTMAAEIANQVDHLDYIVVAVSTGGTITGISAEIKHFFPNIKVVAVDVEGSKVFPNIERKRNIPGIGSSLPSRFISVYGSVDEVVILSEKEIIEGARLMATTDYLFAGLSTGGAYAVAKRIQEKNKDKNLSIMIVCPDRGTHYLEMFND